MFASITEPNQRRLQWLRNTRSSLKHVLTSPAGPVATLSFPGAIGSLAVGETAHGAWTFKREGFLHPRVSIRRAGSDVAIGVLSLSDTRRGTLILAGGEPYGFATSGPSHKSWSFARGGATVVRFERTHGGADVTIEGATTGETLSILCLLGWYIPLVADSEDEALAVTMAALAACC